jgi:hypothetical protein
MPYLHTTLEKYLSSLALHDTKLYQYAQNTLCPRADAIIDSLLVHGIVHGDDENNENFMIRFSADGSSLQLFACDFGSATYRPKSNRLSVSD